jgi:hypothetical protein
MSGRTGKMTAEELALRGPRKALARLRNGKLATFDNEYHVPADASIVAKSFSMSYLKRLEKANA